MKRAAVVIGVKQSGELPELMDAIGSARRMESWAKAQAMDVSVFTDEAGPLQVDTIRKKVHQLVRARNLSQLVVYFAGHGVNIRYNELWLLSDAPIDPQAAISLDGAEKLARQSGIPHVVFISDACRTAPEGIDAQYVTGSDIFPNAPVGGLENQVDFFFASSLGLPALEVHDPRDSAGSYKSLYTEILAATLNGDERAILERASIENKPASVVRPRSLKRTLQAKLDARLREANLPIRAVQVPDARITSDVDAWLSLLPAEWAPQPGRGGGPGAGRIPRRVQLPPQPPATIHDIADQLLEAVMSGKTIDVDTSGLPVDLRGDVDKLVRTLGEGLASWKPVPVGVDCGIGVEGGGIAAVFSTAAGATRTVDRHDLVRIDGIAGPAANLLVVLDDGGSIVLPAIPGHVAHVTLEQGEWVDLAYEATGAVVWQGRPGSEKSKGERLHAVVAMAARLGAFGLAESSRLLDELVAWICTAPSDPGLAVYAAYAAHVHRVSRHSEALLAYFVREHGFSLFDIAMLGGGLAVTGTATGPASPMPPFPMFSKGWGLMPAFGAALPAGLERLQGCLAPSLWSKFTPDGTAILTKEYISRRVV